MQRRRGKEKKESERLTNGRTDTQTTGGYNLVVVVVKNEVKKQRTEAHTRQLAIVVLEQKI